MNVNDWKTGVEQHKPALEIFLQNVLLRKLKVNLLNTSTGSNEDAVEELADSAVIVRAIEGNFETELIFGFHASWISILSKAILNEENPQAEITNDLFQELVANLLQIITQAFAEIGVELAVIEVEHIKPGNLNRSLNLKKYLTANFTLEQKFAVDDNEERALQFSVALAHPNRDKVEMLEIGFSEENPFKNEDYKNISSKYAGQIDLDRVGDGPAKEDDNRPAGNVSMRGKNVEFETFSKSSAVDNSREVRNINILKNVNMNLSVELGRRKIPLGEILKMVKGSVIELDKLAGDPVEVLVNGQKIARGDVVVIDEHFGVRITDMLATKEHLRELN